MVALATDRMVGRDRRRSACDVLKEQQWQIDSTSSSTSFPPTPPNSRSPSCTTQIEAVVSRLHGQIENTENWGRKRLAYEIGHYKEGVYVLEVINGSGELMKELDRRLKVMDQVIRHMVVRVDEEKKVVERTQTKRQTESERRRVKRGLPPQRQPGEGRSAATRTMPTTIALTEWRFSDAIRTRTLGRRRRAAAARQEAGRQGKGSAPPMFRRRKVCKFCADKIDDINYKDVKLLGPFVPERGKILPRRISGTCAMHQRKLQTAIKRARQIALIPYVTD